MSLIPEQSNALEPIEQQIERLPNATRRLAAQLRLPLEIEAVWAVLTDYDRLTSFIPNLISSRVVSREGLEVVLEQEGAQRFAGLRFTAKVTLELRERRPDGMPISAWSAATSAVLRALGSSALTPSVAFGCAMRC